MPWQGRSQHWHDERCDDRRACTEPSDLAPLGRAGCCARDPHDRARAAASRARADPPARGARGLARDQSAGARRGRRPDARELFHPRAVRRARAALRRRAPRLLARAAHIVHRVRIRSQPESRGDDGRRRALQALFDGGALGGRNRAARDVLLADERAGFAIVAGSSLVFATSESATPPAQPHARMLVGGPLLGAVFAYARGGRAAAARSIRGGRLRLRASRSWHRSSRRRWTS